MRTRDCNKSLSHLFLYLGEQSLFTFKMKESKFQHDLIKDLYKMFPRCFVLKNDAGYIQGVPDLTILYGDKWATLECKKTRTASHQPNQDYYVALLNKMGFSAYIYPENKEEVLHDLYRYFTYEER